jgi:hypothetical protein
MYEEKENYPGEFRTGQTAKASRKASAHTYRQES